MNERVIDEFFVEGKTIYLRTPSGKRVPIADCRGGWFAADYVCAALNLASGVTAERAAASTTNPELADNTGPAAT